MGHDLAIQARHHILNGFSPATLSTYLTAWNAFKRFHTTTGVPFPSNHLSVIAAFVTYAHSHLHLRTSTIQVYLSGLNFFFKLIHGSPSSSTTHPHIIMLLRGLQRSEAPVPPGRQPLTSDSLQKCLTTLRAGYLSPLTDLTLESMFLLNFFGFL